MMVARVTSRDVHAHDLLLGVLVQRVGTELPPAATLLVPAERIRDVDRVPVVHPHAAGLEPVRDPDGRLEVLPPHAGREAEVAVIRYIDRLIIYHVQITVQ